MGPQDLPAGYPPVLPLDRGDDRSPFGVIYELDRGRPPRPLALSGLGQHDASASHQLHAQL